MNINKLERRIKELDRDIPLLEKREDLQKKIESEEFKEKVHDIEMEFHCRIKIFVDEDYVNFIIYQIYKDINKGLAYRIIY